MTVLAHTVGSYPLAWLPWGTGFSVILSQILLLERHLDLSDIFHFMIHFMTTYNSTSPNLRFRGVESYITRPQGLLLYFSLHSLLLSATDLFPGLQG